MESEMGKQIQATIDGLAKEISTMDLPQLADREYLEEKLGNWLENNDIRPVLIPDDLADAMIIAAISRSGLSS